MKQIHLLSLLLFCLLSITNSFAQYNPKFDFSGYRQFLNIKETLEQDHEPTTTQWEELFNTPGYKILTKSEFKKEFFVENFMIAYKPSNSEKLNHLLQTSGKQSRFLKHALYVKKNLNKISKHLHDLHTSSRLKIETEKLLSEHLPSNIIKNAQNPTVAFVIFANDARGYTPVVVDIAFSMGYKNYLPYLLAHEFHHFYRNQYATLQLPNEDAADYNLLWVMNQIHLEGMADQIDKEAILLSESALMKDSKRAKQFQQQLKNAPQLMRQMDSLLIEINNAGNRYGILSEEVRTLLPQSGHILGFYMANQIRKQFGKGKLMEEIGNPFHFFRLYQKAAKRVKFSSQSMQLLEKLEAQYVHTYLDSN